MMIHLLEETWECANKSSEVDAVIERINEITAKLNVVVDHITIDGSTLDEELYTYLLANIEKVNNLHVHTVTEREYIDQMILTATDYLTRALPEIAVLANQLYTTLNGELWNKIDELLEGLQYIILTVGNISSARDGYTSFPDSKATIDELNGVLQQFMEAAVQKDNTLMADLLKFEFTPQLELLLNMLNSTIDSEVKRNDLQ